MWLPNSGQTGSMLTVGITYMYNCAKYQTCTYGTFLTVKIRFYPYSHLSHLMAEILKTL